VSSIFSREKAYAGESNCNNGNARCIAIAGSSAGPVVSELGSWAIQWLPLCSF
jgi:hypothetical protein